MTSPLRAAWLATSWLTVVPVPQPKSAPTRRDGGAALAATPVVGIALGAVLAALAYGLSRTDLPTLMIGLLLVTIAAALTRGMHLDGLADTADGLGCFGPPERAQQVMREGSVGPFGAATLVLAIAIQATGFAALTDHGHWLQLGYAVAIGRVAAVLTARSSLKPFSDNGFGALVIGTQRVSAILWVVAAIAAGAVIDLDQPWRGPVITAVVLAIVWAFGAHCARRFGGLSGDTLGASIEIATAATLFGLLA
ncbi:adenosylcobinamide-GDP ribazoletransferase [Jongsikchunia kroppenstedtii]|uniref:adenosylcobinamide-GDP ribazoletransferase n=1 Tax=Jongsikchunia kroppenstedtii TaxID=1121721 RepID=UPI00035F01FA|nr:adenosylcobinamide-GDP ribazoletransferase [Jongsikchunia kroppenstedtii]